MYTAACVRYHVPRGVGLEVVVVGGGERLAAVEPVTVRFASPRVWEFHSGVRRVSQAVVAAVVVRLADPMMW